jgi:hypothetical protein
MPGLVAIAAHQNLDPGASEHGSLARRGAGRVRPRHRLASCRGAGSPRPACRWSLVDVDRQEATVVRGVEQRELLAAVNPVLGVVAVQHDPPRHLREAVAEQLDHRRHHALQRDRAGHRSRWHPLSRPRSARHGSGSSHPSVLDSPGCPRVLYAVRQALGDAEPALDLGQDQNAAVRGQPAAVEGDVHRLVGDR